MKPELFAKKCFSFSLTEKHLRKFLSQTLYHCSSERDVGHEMSTERATDEQLQLVSVCGIPVHNV